MSSSQMVAIRLPSRRSKQATIPKTMMTSSTISTTWRTRRRKFSQLIAKDLLQSGRHARSHVAVGRGQESSPSRRSPMVATPAPLMRPKTAMSRNALSIAQGPGQSGASAQAHAVAEHKQESTLSQRQRIMAEKLAQLPSRRNATNSLALLIAQAPGVTMALAQSHVVQDSNPALSVSPRRLRTAVMLAQLFFGKNNLATPTGAL